LATHGKVTKVDKKSPDWPDTYHFESATGTQCTFVIRGDEFLLVGDNHLFAVPIEMLLGMRYYHESIVPVRVLRSMAWVSSDFGWCALHVRNRESTFIAKSAVLAAEHTRQNAALLRSAAF
jgi:hypothetical protein